MYLMVDRLVYSNNSNTFYSTLIYPSYSTFKNVHITDLHFGLYYLEYILKYFPFISEDGRSKERIE